MAPSCCRDNAKGCQKLKGVQQKGPRFCSPSDQPPYPSSRPSCLQPLPAKFKGGPAKPQKSFGPATYTEAATFNPSNAGPPSPSTPLLLCKSTRVPAVCHAQAARAMSQGHSAPAVLLMLRWYNVSTTSRGGTRWASDKARIPNSVGVWFLFWLEGREVVILL